MSSAKRSANRRKPRVRKELLCSDCGAAVELDRLDCYCMACRTKRYGEPGRSDAFEDAVQATECPDSASRRGRGTVWEG